MTDLVEQLRAERDQWKQAAGVEADERRWAHEEIKRLREKVERLEGALADVLAYYSMPKEEEK